ncbi:MAG: TolC family protein [Elusimicrobiota bacterium]
MNRIPLRLGILFCFGSAIAVRAGAATLTLSDCVKLAQARSPVAVRGALEESRALAARDDSRRARLPQLVGDGKLTRSDDATTNLPDDNRGLVRLEQNMTPWSPEWVRGRQREAEARAAGFGRVESAQDAELAVKALYFSILREEDSVRALDQIERELKDLLDTVLPKFTVGRVAAFDPVKVRVALSDLARTRELLQASLRGDRTALAQALGLDGSDGWELSPLSATPELGDEAAAPRGLLDNPTLEALSEQLRAAEFGLSAVRRARAGDLSGSADYGYTGQSTSGMIRGWSVSAALRIPIFDWGRITAQTAAESTAVGLARNTLEAERQKTTADLIETLATARAHRADQGRLTALLPDVKETALASVARYRRGGAGILEVSDAVNLWLQTLLNERAAFYGYLSDLARLERLTGGRVKVAYAP